MTRQSSITVAFTPFCHNHKFRSARFSPRTDLSLETWTVGKDCLTVDPSSGFELLTTACWSSEPLPPASKDLVGVCQYEECRTVDLNLCAFPFK